MIKLSIALRLISIVFLMSAICSCATQKRCNERFPPKESVKDSIVYKEILRDTVIYVKGEDILLIDTLPCPELNFTHSETKNHLIQRITIKKGIIKAECKEDSLIKVTAKLHDKLWIFSHAKKDNTIIKEYKDHWYDLPLIWYFAVSFPLILGWIYIKTKPF